MSENQCFTSDGGCGRHTDCERAALRAEVERLQDELERQRSREHARDVAYDERYAKLEDNLAAANTLLAQWFKNYAKQSNLSRRTKAHLTRQAKATPAESVECDSCSMRGRDCDGGDHCDNCSARMDGDIAATADVCHDCWQSTKARAAAANTAIRAAGILFEQMARDDHRHPPDDHVAPETWKRVCEWQGRPEVVAAMNVSGGDGGS